MMSGTTFSQYLVLVNHKLSQPFSRPYKTLQDICSSLLNVENSLMVK